MYIRFRKLIHWLCASAFLFSITAPSIAHSYTSLDASNALKMEICVADGSKRVIDVDPDNSQPIQDCPHCVTQSLPPIGLLGDLAFPIPWIQRSHFNLYSIHLQTTFYWIKLPSRGPPHQSNV